MLIPATRSVIAPRGRSRTLAVPVHTPIAAAHPKVASEALGHAPVGFTMDVYAHVVPSMQEAAGRAIEAALGGAIAGGSP